jgi:hypothetical protein
MSMIFLYKRMHCIARYGEHLNSVNNKYSNCLSIASPTRCEYQQPGAGISRMHVPMVQEWL